MLFDWIGYHSPYQRLPIVKSSCEPIQHSSCCCGHCFNCFISFLLVHVLRAVNFRFLFLRFTKVVVRWTINCTCWIGYVSNDFYFISRSRSICVAPVENPIQRDQRPIPLDYYIFAWDLEHVEKEIQPISCCNHLEIWVELFLLGSCLSLSKGVLRLSAFSPRIFWSILQRTWSRIPFFFPWLFFATVLAHTLERESVVVNGRLPSFLYVVTRAVEDTT